MRAHELAENLPDDATLHRYAKAVLLECAESCLDEKNRVAAARALCDVTKPPEKPAEKAVVEQLEELPTAELVAIKAKLNHEMHDESGAGWSAQ